MRRLCEVLLLDLISGSLRFEDSPILDQRLRSITAVPEDAEELIDGTTNYNAEGDILFLPLDALENVFQPLARGCVCTVSAHLFPRNVC